MADSKENIKKEVEDENGDDVDNLNVDGINLQDQDTDALAENGEQDKKEKTDEKPVKKEAGNEEKDAAKDKPADVAKDAKKVKMRIKKVKMFDKIRNGNKEKKFNIVLTPENFGMEEWFQLASRIRRLTAKVNLLRKFGVRVDTRICRYKKILEKYYELLKRTADQHAEDEEVLAEYEEIKQQRDEILKMEAGEEDENDVGNEEEKELSDPEKIRLIDELMTELINETLRVIQYRNATLDKDDKKFLKGIKKEILEESSSSSENEDDCRAEKSDKASEQTSEEKPGKDEN